MATEHHCIRIRLYYRGKKWEYPWQVVDKEVYREIIVRNGLAIPPLYPLLPDFEGGIMEGKVIVNKQIADWDIGLKHAIELFEMTT